MTELKFNKNKPCVLCDIDNTLSDATHRAHLVSSDNPKERKWVDFFNLMSGDTAIEPTIKLINSYYMQGLNIILITGRPDTYQDITKLWLNAHNIPYCRLIMKDKKCYRMNGALWKAKITTELMYEKLNIKLAIDDEQAVRDMYNLLGVKNIAPVL